MSDYVGTIVVTDYLYKKTVYYNSLFTVDKTDLVVKLVLDSSNFNFDLANDDGSDFRIVDYNFGISILKTWVANWNKDSKRAILFFKIPYIEAGASVSFDAYWGRETATSISDPDSMGFIFYEDFKTNLSASKWTGTLNSWTSTNDYGYPFGTTTFTTITAPLYGMNSWSVEAGLYSTTSQSIRNST